MQKTRKLLAIVLAVALAALMSVSAFAYTITISPDPTDTATHTYEAYQIFIGDLDEVTDSETGAVTRTLSNIKWGTGIDDTKDKSALATFLNTKAGLSGADALTAAASARQFAEAMEKVTADADKEKLAELLEDLLSTTHTDAVKGNDGKYTITTDTAGYYLIKDKDGSLENAEFGAYTKYILQVVSDVEVDEKAAVPGVDKAVKEDGGDYGETASYALYKDIPFSLTATIPADVALQDYDTYYVEFADTWTEGLTFKQIDSVTATVGSSSVTLSAEAPEGQTADYTFTLDETNRKFNLKIADILAILSAANIDYAGKEVKIEVKYTGYLNEDAVCYNASAEGETANRNDVQLIYSNNPNADQDGKGKTNKDYVFVFTYEVDNTKYHDSKGDNNKMPGAGFTLYDSNNNPVNVIWDAEKHAYRIATAAEAAADGYKPEMFSREETADEGTFNVIGLAPGTYTLRETTTPSGYNTCADITIKIVAATSEDSTGTTASVDMTSSENLTNDLINKKGTVLPTTGGIGTMMIYLFGALLALAAGIVLVARKRARVAA